MFWASATTINERKQLIRAIITEVVFTIDDQRRGAGL